MWVVVVGNDAKAVFGPLSEENAKAMARGFSSIQIYAVAREVVAP